MEKEEEEEEASTRRNSNGGRLWVGEPRKRKSGAFLKVLGLAESRR